MPEKGSLIMHRIPHIPIFSIFFLFSIFSLPLSAQFVSLEGRQFKDEHGRDFYPVVCNFTSDYIYTPSQPQPFFPSPSKDYDGVCYECTSLNACLDQFSVHFRRLRELNFNAIRLYMANPGYYNKPGDNTKGWAVKAMDLDFLRSVSCWTSKPANDYTRSFYLSQSFGPDRNLDLVLGYYDAILLRAARESLKVLLNIGVASGDYSPVFMDRYGTYLALVARHFASPSTPDSVKQALMAYVIFEEPSKSWNLSGLWPNVKAGHSKPEVASFVNRWVDSLKRYDPNHLITMGFTPYDLFEYDPAMMNLDFACPHIYPEKQAFQGTEFMNGMLGQAQGWFYWMAENLPMPYLIGETGFRSRYRDETHPGNQGSNEQQKEFAGKTLQIARDCRASGYSWWNFQDYYWGNNRDCNWGLYGRDPKTLKTEEKPVANAFRKYDPASPANVYRAPASYYDPYLHGKYARTYGVPRSNYLRGHVQDQYGKPVSGAYVRGQTRLSGKGKGLRLDLHYTFTDSKGDFVLIPLDFEPGNEPDYNVVETLYVTGAGYSSFRTESWGAAGIPNPVTVVLERY